MKQNLHIAIYFRSDEGELSPEGPGWYILATRPRAPEVDHDTPVEDILPRIRLDNKDVPKIAKVLDNFAKGKELNWRPHYGRADISLEQAVVEATQAGREAIQRQLAEAEEAVRRLESLRARVEEFDVGTS
jgi:hypothetical protein